MMLPKYLVLLLTSVVAISHGAPAQKSNDDNSKEEMQNPHSLYIGPPFHYIPNQYPPGVDPQFGYNFIPNRQYYPNGQPPVILYGGPGLPGHQPFPYRPGSPPPGNFLIPQPGPGIFGHPQSPLPSGFPKPAYVPPIEKDAEEVPDLAGNHTPTRTGKPSKNLGRPEKIETFDEVESGEEVDDLERGEKVPDVFYPKKPFPNRPVLRPGQQFFILNGNTLFSNIPLEDQPNSQIPFQRNVNERQINRGQSEIVSAVPVLNESENYVSLNNLGDFKRDILLRQPGPTVQQLVVPDQQPPCLHRNAPQDGRLGRNFQFNPVLAPLNPLVYPYVIAFDVNRKEDDDTVTIDAKPEEEKKKKVEDPTPPSANVEEPSISQAKPSSLALSGIGGVASAGSRGTALVGIKGIAVASPEATAVAGPAKDEPVKQSKPRRGKEESH